MFGFIYKTTNLKNNKSYIGKKQYNQSDWETYLGSGIILNRAINKYGKDNFKRIIIEECETRDLLNEREKYWIAFYNAVESPMFYNIAFGGEGGYTVAGYSQEEKQKHFEKITNSRINTIKEKGLYGENTSLSILTEKQVLEIIELLLQSELHTVIAQKYNVSSATVQGIYLHRTWKHLTQNIIFPKPDLTKKIYNSHKNIDQYTIDGKYIKTFYEIEDIIKELDLKAPDANVYQCCNGKLHTCGGYVWRYEGEPFNKYEVKNKNQISVDQYDQNGNYLNTFLSIGEAYKITGINRTSIKKVIQGKNKSAGGYYWTISGEKLIIPEYKYNNPDRYLNRKRK